MAGENSEASSSGSEAGEQQGTPEGGSVSSPEQHPGQNKDLLKDVLSAAVPEIAVIRAIDEGTAMIWEKALHREGKGKITPQEIVDYIKEKAKKPDKPSENKNQAGKGAISSGAGTGQPSRSFEPDKDQLLEDRISEELDKSLKEIGGRRETPQERFDRKWKGNHIYEKVENSETSRKNESSGGEPARESSPPEKTTPPPNKPSEGGEIPPNAERGAGRRPFNEVQADLKQLIDKPDPKRESELKLERARLLREAKDVGIFDSLKRHLREVQNSYDYIEAGDKILKINVKNIETEARSLDGWSDDFEGMISEYRDVALLNMGHALFSVDGKATNEKMAKLEREIEVRGWGTVPPGLETLAREHLKSPPPTVEHAHQSTVGTPPDDSEMLAILREQVELQRRATAAAERNPPVTPEQQRTLLLNYEEGGDTVIEIPPLVSNIWEGLTVQERELWQTRLKLSNARARKQIAKLDDIGTNPELQSLNLRELNMLTNHRGVAEAISIYTVCIADPRYLSNPEARAEARGALGFIAGEPPGMINIRDLQSLTFFREAVRGYLGDRLGLDEAESRNVEQMAYNFIYVTNLAEETDVSATPRLPNVLNQGLRDAMHPRTKIIDAANKGDRWPPNIFGEWARYHKAEISRNPNLVPFTDNLGPSFLGKKDVLGKDTDQARGTTLKEFLLTQGKNILSGRSDSTRIDWNLPGASETPWGGYFASVQSQITLLYDTLNTGQPPRDKTPETIQNAFRKLGAIDRRTRETLLWLIYQKIIKVPEFLKARSSKFEPQLSVFARMGLNDRIKGEFPGYFD